MPSEVYRGGVDGYVLSIKGGGRERRSSCVLGFFLLREPIDPPDLESPFPVVICRTAILRGLGNASP